MSPEASSSTASTAIWCEKQELLVRRWAERAAGYRWCHNHARLFFKRQNDWLSYPAIVISSITGVGGFAVLTPNQEDAPTPAIIMVQYAFAFLNVLGGILTSVSKFSQAQKLCEHHSQMCVLYSKFYRSIDMELSLDRKDRVPVMEFVERCRAEYDRLLDEAPDIPSASIHAFNLEFPDKENKPDVCNGLSVITEDISRTSSKTNIFSKLRVSASSIDERKFQKIKDQL